MNQVILIGNVGKDPVIRMSKTGMAIASFSIATKRKGQGGQDSTDWNNVIAFGGLAESIGNQVRKGSYITVIGRMQTRSYQDRNGQKKRTTEVVANYVALNLSSVAQQTTQNSGWGSGQWGNGNSPMQETNGNFEQFGQTVKQPMNEQELDGFVGNKEDIPF